MFNDGKKDRHWIYSRYNVCSRCKIDPLRPIGSGNSPCRCIAIPQRCKSRPRSRIRYRGKLKRTNVWKINFFSFSLNVEFEEAGTIRGTKKKIIIEFRRSRTSRFDKKIFVRNFILTRDKNRDKIGERGCRWKFARNPRSSRRDISPSRGGGRCREPGTCICTRCPARSICHSTTTLPHYINFENRILSRPIIPSSPIWTG